MNFAEADYVMTNTPGMLRAMGQMMTDLGVRPEIEVFETGHLWFAKQLVEEGIIEDPVMIQMCMGIPWGAPDDLNTFMSMVNNTPDELDLFGIFDRTQRNAFRRRSGARRWQCPRRPRRQPVVAKRASSPPTRSWWKWQRPSSPTWARP